MTKSIRSKDFNTIIFDRKALIYFISVPDFEVDIFSETYGYIGKKDLEGIYQYDWSAPFGFNSNGKLVFWLGDLNYGYQKSSNSKRV